MFAALYAADGTAPEALVAVARDFSPRIEACAAREVAIDLAGLQRLFGEPRAIAEELRRTAADRALRVRVAVAGTRTAARLLAHARAGITVVERGQERAALAPLPLALLGVLQQPDATPAQPEARSPQPAAFLQTLRRWGLRTLGDFAALPADDVAARLGQEGVAWQRLACGEDPCPLVPALPEERFEQAIDLEWPIEGLEPLSFVLGRLIEPLSAHLERRDRGAAVLHVRLHLVDRTVHARTLQLPAPMRDARTLRTLAMLDLESHPPPAAVDRVVAAVDPTPGRVLQFSLLTRPLPSPEQLSTLLARLNALMGEGRCGAPAEVDSWKPGAFAITPFAPREWNDRHPHATRRHEESEVSLVRERTDLGVSVSASVVGANDAAPAVALRRFRCPVPARVQVEAGKPARVMTDRRGLNGGRVEMCAGPWRLSGEWWIDRHAAPRAACDGSAPARRSFGEGGWDRDEWDVTLHDGATYRVYRERDTDHWFMDGIID